LRSPSTLTIRPDPRQPPPKAHIRAHVCDRTSPTRAMVCSRRKPLDPGPSRRDGTCGARRLQRVVYDIFGADTVRSTSAASHRHSQLHTPRTRPTSSTCERHVDVSANARLSVRAACGGSRRLYDGRTRTLPARTIRRSHSGLLALGTRSRGTRLSTRLKSTSAPDPRARSQPTPAFATSAEARTPLHPALPFRVADIRAQRCPFAVPTYRSRAFLLTHLALPAPRSPRGCRRRARRSPTRCQRDEALVGAPSRLPHTLRGLSNAPRPPLPSPSGPTVACL